MNRYSYVWCVGSVDRDYNRAWDSNYGSFLDVFGPGVDVVSASRTGGGLNKWVEMSGTSMATPFVSGILATFLSVEGRSLGNSHHVYRRSISNVVFDAVGNMPWGITRTPNRFATTGLNNPYKNPGQPYRYASIEINNVGDTCKIDLTQKWTCEPADSNLYATLTITDPVGNTIYKSSQSAHSPGIPINDKDPLQIDNENMLHPLFIVGEHEKDYVQFFFGDLSWTTGTTHGDNKCKLVGDDWNKDGPGACPSHALVSNLFPFLSTYGTVIFLTTFSLLSFFHCISFIKLKQIANVRHVNYTVSEIRVSIYLLTPFASDCWGHIAFKISPH